MNLIYIVTEDGEQRAYEDSQVYEMLAQQVLSQETPYWQEGMAEWRPLYELQSRKGNSIAPARRTQGQDDQTSVRSRPEPVAPTLPPEGSVEPPQRVLSETARKRKAYRRFFFRINPFPLTVSIQVLTAVSVVLEGTFVYLCLDKAYGWSSGGNSGAMTDLLNPVQPQVNLSPSDGTFFLECLGGLFLVHVVVEILFFYWVYYANKNSRGFATNIRFQPDWAVMCFFVPFANLYRPYQVIQEIWKVSENPRSWIGRRDSIYVACWFIVRWSFLGLARGAYYAFYPVVDDPAIKTRDLLIFLATVAGDIALIELATVILVTAITSRQRRWVRQMG